MSDWKSRATVVSNGTNDWRKRAIAPAGSLINDYAEKLQPEQVQPDWISTGERMIAKNLANSPQKQMEYLKQEHPDKEFAVNANGEVLAKDKGAAKWQVLDPSGFDSVGEFAKDAGDILYDIPAGVAQSAATTAGAAGAAIAGTPAAAIPGAMAAGAASGAGLEAFRQKLGSMLGIPQEVDGGQVGMAAATGAVSPLLFGAGKPVSAAVKSLAASRNIPVEEAAKLLEQSGRGLVERGYDVATRKMAPAILSAATGVDKDAIKYYGSNINDMQKLKEQGITDALQNTSNKVGGYFDGNKEIYGKDIQRIMENAGQVDVRGAKKAFLDRINFLLSRADKTEADAAELASLQSTYAKYFGLDKPKVPSVAEINANPQMQKLFASLDDANARAANVPQPMPPANIAEPIAASKVPEASLQFQPEAQNLYKRSVVANSAIDEHSGVLQAEAEKLANHINNKQAQLHQATSGAEIKSILAEIKATQARLAEIGTEKYMPNSVDGSRAFDLQKNLKQVADFNNDVTPATVSVQGSAKNAYTSLNEAFSDATDGLSQEAKDKYSALLKLREEIEPKFKDAQTTYNTAAGLDNRGRTVLKETLGKMSKNGELDIMPDLEKIRAYDQFYNKNSAHVKPPLATLGGMFGTLIGYKTGGGYAPAALGGAAGTGAGIAAGSKPVLEKLITAGVTAERAARRLQPSTGVGPIMNAVPWMLMKPQEQQNGQ